MYISELAKAKPHWQRTLKLGRMLFIDYLAPPHVLETLGLLFSPYFFQQWYGAVEYVIPSPLIPNRAEFYNPLTRRSIRQFAACKKERQQVLP
jgi:hypothetical protein